MQSSLVYIEIGDEVNFNEFAQFNLKSLTIFSTKCYSFSYVYFCCGATRTYLIEFCVKYSLNLDFIFFSVSLESIKSVTFLFIPTMIADLQKFKIGGIYSLLPK